MIPVKSRKRALRHSLFYFVGLVVIGALILGGVYMINDYHTAQENAMREQIQQQCIAAGGIYLENYNECEHISRETCENIGGTFEECASACRHDPDAELCILVCVPVCTL